MFAHWSLPKSWVLYPNVHSIFITSCAIPITLHQRPITNPKNISMLYLVQRPNPRYVDMVVFVWTRQHECREINRLQNERDIIAVVSHLLAIVSLLYVADNSGKCVFSCSSSSSTLSSRWFAPALWLYTCLLLLFWKQQCLSASVAPPSANCRYFSILGKGQSVDQPFSNPTW